MAKNNPINSWADQFKELPHQSNFHEKVRTIFRTDLWFMHLKCYQEVPVSNLIPEYYTNQHRFDWYIKELDTILELHGEQHYKPTNFGSMSFEETQRKFAEGQARDKSKKEAALAANIKYISISFKEVDKLDGNYLKSLLLGRLS